MTLLYHVRATPRKNPALKEARLLLPAPTQFTAQVYVTAFSDLKYWPIEKLM
jgi:hypothetical protein